MKQPHDPLEIELQALRQHAPSPRLRRRIADRLAPTALPRARPRWSLALAGGLIAACLMTAILLRREGDPLVDVEPRAALPDPLLARAFDESLPTLWAYRRALAGPPQALEALLDEHAGRTPEPDVQLAQVHAFTRSETELHTILGEL